MLSLLRNGMASDQIDNVLFWMGLPYMKRSIPFLAKNVVIFYLT